MIRILLVMALALSPEVHAQSEVVVLGAHLQDQSEGDARRTTEKMVRMVDLQRELHAVSPSEARSRVRGRGDQILDDALTGQGRALLAEGRLLFEQADLEQALQRLDGALVALESAMAGTTDSRPLIDTLLLKGMVQLSMGEPDAARGIYKRVLQLDPARELDTVHYPPKVVGLFTEVRQAVLAAPRASLGIEASDPQARIFVDGRMRGQGTAEVKDLITGKHHVLVSSDSGHRSYAEVQVSPGARKNIKANLYRRFVGRAGIHRSTRSKQTEDLYRALGDRVTGGLVLVAGELGAGKVGVQLFEPRTGNFSKVLVAPSDGDAQGAIVGLVSRVGTFLNDAGVLRSDQVGSSAMPLDIGSNSVLAEVLLDSRSDALQGNGPVLPRPAPSAKRQGTPWYIWAGVGVLAAGATGAAFALQGDDTSSGTGTKGGTKTSTSNTGTVVVPSP